jgi:predicted MFS family arabinose efflux permease
MIRDRNERKWLLIAAIAIMVALVLLLVPQMHSGHASVWLAILPVFFIGVIWLLCLLPASGSFSLAHAKEAPALQPSFQRPPPFTIA